MTVDELKSVIHEVIAEDMGAWRETFEIMADKKIDEADQTGRFGLGIRRQRLLCFMG